MIITVVGLGLIGGSFCKAIKTRTEYTCLGADIDKGVLDKAISESAIDEICTDLSASDMTIVCLYPDATVKFLLDNKDNFRKGSIVIDTCGIKSKVVSAVAEPMRNSGVCFIGAHPMAGREFSGYDYSVPNLFEGASFIMTPDENIPDKALETVCELVHKLGFIRTVKTSPEEHDSIIAYTSQLAHIVSSAYIKSPTLNKEAGFSAGSFKDMTRVAKLNEDMWTTLFLDNRDALLFEVEQIIERLEEYRNALEGNDSSLLKELLRDGRILKEKSMHIN